MRMPCEMDTCLIQGSVTKWTEKGTENLVLAYGLLFGGLIQFLAGMWGELYIVLLHILKATAARKPFPQASDCQKSGYSETSVDELRRYVSVAGQRKAGVLWESRGCNT